MSSIWKRGVHLGFLTPSKKTKKKPPLLRPDKREGRKGEGEKCVQQFGEGKEGGKNWPKANYSMMRERITKKKKR